MSLSRPIQDSDAKSLAPEPSLRLVFRASKPGYEDCVLELGSRDGWSREEGIFRIVLHSYGELLSASMDAADSGALGEARALLDRAGLVDPGALDVQLWRACLDVLQRLRSLEDVALDAEVRERLDELPAWFTEIFPAGGRK